MNNNFYRVTPNYNKRTFTIRVANLNGKVIFKYRTVVFSQEEFDSMEYNTQIDWYNFLKTDEYYLIKRYLYNW